MTLDLSGPAERCESCQGVTLGATGEQKWCCYCGNRLSGDYVLVKVADNPERDFHVAIKCHLNKRQQGLVMREFRRALVGYGVSPK